MILITIILTLHLVLAELPPYHGEAQTEMVEIEMNVFKTPGS